MSRHRFWRAPPCASGKASYHTQGRGLRAVALIRVGVAQSPVKMEVPVGVYRCGCGAWHMTSQVRPGTVVAP